MFFILQFMLLFDLKAGLVIYLSGLAHFISTKSGTKGMAKNLDRPAIKTGLVDLNTAVLPFI